MMVNDADTAISAHHQNGNTLITSALSNDSIAESGSPKFNCALPSVTQACKIIRWPYHSWDNRSRNYQHDQMKILSDAVFVPGTKSGAETE